MKQQKKKDIIIPRKAMFGIAPAIAIIAMLISKSQPGPLLLFLIGISTGILIGKGFFEKRKKIGSLKNPKKDKHTQDN